MQIIKDTISFIKTLSFVDIVFFFAVLALMLLIITLIYFIKENKEEEKEDNFDFFDKDDNDKTPKTEMESLKAISEALEQAEPTAIDLNKYEEEQEEKAIISYEELKSRRNDFAINYTDEEEIAEDVSVKKVDLEHLLNKNVEVKPELKVSVISYEKEEAFLDALKRLQQC